MDEIEWVDPPPRRGSNTISWMEALSPLLEYPKRWAKVRHYAHSTSGSYAAAEINNGRRLHLPPGKWEAVGRCTDLKDKSKGSDVYVRYMGEDDG